MLRQSQLKPFAADHHIQYENIFADYLNVERDETQYHNSDKQPPVLSAAGVTDSKPRYCRSFWLKSRALWPRLATEVHELGDIVGRFDWTDDHRREQFRARKSLAGSLVPAQIAAGYKPAAPFVKRNSQACASPDCA